MLERSVIIIPARMGSSRLPGKPLAKIGEKPMIVHVAERACESFIGRNDIFVACAEKEIYDVVTSYNINAILTNPNHPSGTDRIYEALTQINDNSKYEYIINLQGDLPFINPTYINKLTETMTEFGQADITTLATKIDQQSDITNPSIVKTAISFSDDNKQYGKGIYFSRSPIPYNSIDYYHHIGIYGYKRSAIEKFVKLPQSYLESIEKLEQLRAIENNMNIYVAVVEENPLSVDTPEDLEKLRNTHNSKG